MNSCTSCARRARLCWKLGRFWQKHTSSTYETSWRTTFDIRLPAKNVKIKKRLQCSHSTSHSKSSLRGVGYRGWPCIPPPQKAAAMLLLSHAFPIPFWHSWAPSGVFWGSVLFCVPLRLGSCCLSWGYSSFLLVLILFVVTVGLVWGWMALPSPANGIIVVTVSGCWSNLASSVE